MQSLFESDSPNPSMQQIICSLILGADHPITAKEIQTILEAVAEDDRKETEEAAKEVTDDDLEALQTQADSAAAEVTDAAIESAQKPREEVSAETGASPPLPQTEIISVSAIKKIVEDLQKTFRQFSIGIELIEISDGYRFQTSSDCGKWVRKMLNKGKPARLSRPSIETLAIIAYRQPVTRSEIESIRGVNAGHVIKALMEMQLVRMIGRSDLPGRPFLFGTTASFLDHFGLKSLKDLEPIKK